MSVELTKRDEAAIWDGGYVPLLKKSAVVWLCVGVVMCAQDILRALYWGEPHPSEQGLYWMLGCGISAFLTPWILSAATRWPVEFHGSLTNVRLHVAFSIVFGVVRAAIESVILLPLQVNEYFGLRPEWATSMPRVFTAVTLHDLMSGITAYWIIISIQATRLYHRKLQERARQAMQLELQASELRVQLAQAHLGALKLQLQPHFLFNTLNAIVVLVRKHRGKQAEDALTRFSDLLHAVLEDIDEQEVPLYREMEVLQLYLSIEKLRFPDGLKTKIDVSPAALDAAVPHMGLQPLVENAIRHGISTRAEGGIIAIKADVIGERLQVTICDNGAGFRRASVPGHGLGLKNLKGRLQQLYSGAADLRIDAGLAGTKATLSMPYRVHDDANAKLIGEFAGQTRAVVAP